MFTLIDDLVEEIVIDDHIFQLNMAFDNIIRINNIQNDDCLSDSEQLIKGAQLLFINPPSIGLHQLCEAFIKAYVEVIGMAKDDVEYDLRGNPMPKANSGGEGDNEVYSDLTQDAEYIYASFRMDYGIDLLKERGKMHWYVFRALLAGLSDEVIFKKVVRIRQEPLPKSGKARTDMEKLKKQYALKPSRKAVRDEGNQMQEM